METGETEEALGLFREVLELEPRERPGTITGRVVGIPVLGRLHHAYRRAA